MKKKSLILLVILLGFVRLPAQDTAGWDSALEKVQAIASILEKGYYKDLEMEKMVFASIKGVLETLDPHSYFLEPDNFARMREDYVGKYFGLGIQIQKQEDRLVVIAPIEGTPAWRLGIQPGDVISKIEGESTKPISSQEAMQKLRGDKGTKVSITLVRESLDKPFDLTITREEIPLYSVPYGFMLNQTTGYIYVRNFAEYTDQELQEKLVKLKDSGMKNLILDLRGNSGGTLVASIEVSDEFLSKGARVVSIRGRNPAYNNDFTALRNDQYEKLPLVVLIDQGTASASEIVSGAVMDNDRGLIVGHDSWGKGLVQTVFPLAANMAVAITTAKYLTPSGRAIQRDYSHIEDYLMGKQAAVEDREIKYTLKGRKVLGQGGITPDYEVPVSMKPFTFELMARGAYFGYARKLTQHQTALSAKFVFPQDRGQAAATAGKIVVGQTFVVSPEVLEDFKSHIRTLKVAFDEAKFKDAEDEIKRELDREIASAVWGVEEGIRAYRRSDPVVAKALGVMPEAARFVE
ncbi:MAG: S41 family peptidase [Candidatus Aminicenantales bacterium]